MRLALVVWTALPGGAVAQAAEQWTEIDRVVATIDGKAVLQSDILLENAIGLLEGAGEKGSLEDAYINRLLILREVEDVGGFRLSVGLEESAYQGYVARYGGQQKYREELARWGLDEAEVGMRLKRALLASLYTENRIRFFVRVLPEDVEKAYAQDPSRWGAKGLTESWDEVRATLEEDAFEHEKTRWLDSLATRYRLRRLDAEGGEGP